MYFLFSESRNEYITATFHFSKGGKSGYRIIYGPGHTGCRWATKKGAQTCIDRLVASGSLPEDHDIVVAYVS